MKKKEERWEESVFLIKRLGEEEMTAEHRKPSTHTHTLHTLQTVVTCVIMQKRKAADQEPIRQQNTILRTGAS